MPSPFPVFFPIWDCRNAGKCRAGSHVSSPSHSLAVPSKNLLAFFFGLRFIYYFSRLFSSYVLWLREHGGKEIWEIGVGSEIEASIPEPFLFLHCFLAAALGCT